MIYFRLILFKNVDILFFKLGFIEIFKKKIGSEYYFQYMKGEKDFILSIIFSWYTG